MLKILLASLALRGNTSDLNIGDDRAKKTPVHLLMEGYLKKVGDLPTRDCIQQLLDVPVVDVNLPNVNKETAFAMAVMDGDEWAAKAFLAAGGDPDTKVSPVDDRTLGEVIREKYPDMPKAGGRPPSIITPKGTLVDMW